MRLDHITKDDVDVLTLTGPAPSLNCALRTLRRMLHKAEECDLLTKVPRFKLLPEHGRKLRLDDDAEQKLLVAATGHGKDNRMAISIDQIGVRSFDRHR
jgi:hypothetical protein